MIPRGDRHRALMKEVTMREKNSYECGLPDKECLKERARGNRFADEYEKEHTEAPELERYR